MDPGVEVSSKAMVTPARRTAFRGHLFLSCLDIFWKEIHYNRRILFFPGSSRINLEALRRGLSEALVHYYPWAGRLVLDQNKRLVIECNDTGVEFVEASIDFPMADLENQGFQMKPFYVKLCQTLDHQGDNLFTSPLLSVQITRFRDGGLSVGVTHSHVVADGQSLWNFIVGWGECARGAKLSVEPLHDRRLLALRQPSEEKASRMFFKLPPLEHLDRIIDGEEAAPPAPETIKSWTEMTASEEEPLVQCVFVLPASAVLQLKARAGSSFSAYVVTCAHFWQRVAVATAAPPSSPTFFATLANVRSRMSPPLPATYFGNALRFVITQTCMLNVLREPLTVTAERVQAAVSASVDSEGLENFMHWLELHDHRVISQIEIMGLCVHVASSPRFPFYEVDFGWGPAAAARPARVQGNGEMVFFGTRPGLPPGDVEICMPLSASAMRALLEDKEFLACTPVSPFVDDLECRGGESNLI